MRTITVENKFETFHSKMEKIGKITIPEDIDTATVFIVALVGGVISHILEH